MAELQKGNRRRRRKGKREKRKRKRVAIYHTLHLRPRRGDLGLIKSQLTFQQVYQAQAALAARARSAGR